MPLSQEAWGNFYYGRPVEENAHYALFQVVRPARGCASHVLTSDRNAAVFDPARHLGTYHELANAAGARIDLVLDPHLHADHLSGGPALGEHDHIPYYLHPYGAIQPMDMLPARIPYRYLEEGQVLHITVSALRRKPTSLVDVYTADGHYLRPPGGFTRPVCYADSALHCFPAMTAAWRRTSR